MVTAGAMASDFGTFKKKTYPLLTRIGPSLNSLSEFIISTLQWFGSVVNFLSITITKLKYAPNVRPAVDTAISDTVVLYTEVCGF